MFYLKKEIKKGPFHKQIGKSNLRVSLLSTEQLLRNVAIETDGERNLGGGNKDAVSEKESVCVCVCGGHLNPFSPAVCHRRG